MKYVCENENLFKFVSWDSRLSSEKMFAEIPGENDNASLMKNAFFHDKYSCECLVV